MKGLGNATTISFDVNDRKTAHLILLSLAETVAVRLRNSNNCCRVVSINIRNTDFINYSHQKNLPYPTDCTNVIAAAAYELFDERWKGDGIRHLGISLNDLCTNEFFQYSLFDKTDIDKVRAVDKVIDNIRFKYGSGAVQRSSFLHSGIRNMTGGVGEEEYPVESEKLAGNPMLVFRCQSVINNLNKIYEIKFELKTCKWILYKI